MLLHKLKLIKGETYKQMVLSCVTYGKTKYGRCHIAFDDCFDEEMIKSHKYTRRTTGIKSVNIAASEQNIVFTDPKVFLVSLFSKYLQSGRKVVADFSDKVDITK